MNIEEDDKFYFDAEAAERPIRFIERFCKLSVDRFQGEPFILLDWQKDRIIRPLFGWHRRDNGHRRFQELFLLSAKGSGKTPLLAALGMYCLVKDPEAINPHVISMAATFEQANYTFEEGKSFIAQSPELARRCEPQQYKIKLTEKPGKWTLISGKPTGRSGARPSCCIADEAHEWLAPTAETYNLISANLFKRTQPLLLVATNAPSSTTSFCAHLLDRARNVLSGKNKDTTLLPVIFEAPITLDWTSEAAAMAANPSIPDIVTWDQLQPQLQKAHETMADEAKYRRLYLSQQTQTGKNWLDLAVWNGCTEPFDASILKDAVVYLGIDASEHDDLFAVAQVFATPKRFYVDCRSYLPQITAARYEQTHGIPFKKWAEAGDITLVDEATISEDVQKRIAADVIAISKAHKVKAVCYDRAKMGFIVATLEAEGLTCVPVGQGWGVSNGCEELARRMKEKSIQFQPNGVMRACAEVVEVKYDDRGNYWPVKPNAKGTWAGTRAKKIDCISALVTALTEARKHAFPAPKPPQAKAWNLSG